MQEVRQCKQHVSNDNCACGNNHAFQVTARDNAEKVTCCLELAHFMHPGRPQLLTGLITVLFPGKKSHNVPKPLTIWQRYDKGLHRMVHPPR